MLKENNKLIYKYIVHRVKETNGKYRENIKILWNPRNLKKQRAWGCKQRNKVKRNFNSLNYWKLYTKWCIYQLRGKTTISKRSREYGKNESVNLKIEFTIMI